ncbi:hypothetical protein CIG75_04835 [Tumebacillus algifaecis]|uniref:Peptidase M10 metallopeptidase domain-containing protein n=1 Tax=Tumebacillus algifaecis TaxID=1214604 RepID=A0A223CYP9_9BACL|nr:matrixin family metalloprotease [Tumebacillus algifaecis]ASS74375.1 hypothetical protein CIG75_04835 [Tumebacillus algifaecis]
MNKFKIALALTLALTSLTVLEVAHATYYSRDAFYPGNGLPDSLIGALVYFEDSSVSSYGYSSHMLTARTEFDNVPDAVINFRRATSSEINSAPLRFWVVENQSSYWYGKTFNYDSNGAPLAEADAYYSAWSKVDLKLDNKKMDEAQFTTNQRKRVAVHELGHVLSMVHQPSGFSHLASVMQLEYPNSYSLTTVDILNLQYMY